MRSIYIEPNDHELFMTDVDHNLYGFFLDHMDTFRRMWEEQGKTFWVRFLIAFRDYVYNKGHGMTFIHDATLNFCVHKLALVGDGVFLNIHKYFVDGRINKARDFIEDIVCLTRNKHLLQHIGKKSIVNNPFYLKEVRDSFRKLLWYPQSRSMSSQDVVVFQIAFAAPIYVKFGGAITILLKRWLSSKVESVEVSPAYWSPPLHWASKDYVPTPFEYCLAEHWNTNLDEMIGLKGFYKQLQKKKSEFEESKPCGKTPCRNTEEKSYSSEKEAFVDFSFSRFKNDVLDFSSKFTCKLKDVLPEESCMLNPEAVDKILEKEFKERKILEMAERQFEDEQKTKEKRQKKSQKKRNAIRNAIEKAGMDQSKTQPSQTMTNGNASLQNAKVDATPQTAKISVTMQNAKVSTGTTMQNAKLDASVKNAKVGAVVQNTKISATMQNVNVSTGTTMQNAKVSTGTTMQNAKVDASMQNVKINATMQTGKVVSATVQNVKVGAFVQNVKGNATVQNANVSTGTTTQIVKVSTGTTTQNSKVSVGIQTMPLSFLGKKDSKQGALAKNESAVEMPKKDEKAAKPIADNKSTLNGHELGKKDSKQGTSSKNESAVVMPKKDEKAAKPIADNKSMLNGHELGKKDSKQGAPSKNESVVVMPKKDENTGKPIADNKIMLNGHEGASKSSKTIKKKSATSKKSNVQGLNSYMREIVENIDTINSSLEKEAKESVTLHACSHCAKKEVTPKTFKKCSRCKVESIDVPRYYCSRDCQIEDWEECHRKEHSLFQKK